MKKSFAYPIIFMAILTAVFTFALAFLNHTTADRIALNEEIEKMNKILYVFDIDPATSDPLEIEKIFKESIDEEDIDGDKIYTIREGNEDLAYAFPVRGPGLWGSIEAYVAINGDMTEIIGVDFISHSETPGLGGRISEEPYKSQFRGLDISGVENGEYVTYRPASGGNLDAISGATLTSKSVSKLINEDMDKFIKERKGE